MPGRFLDNFDVVLLDMGDTFMFDCDRFGTVMAATYRDLGGTSLSARQLDDIFRRLVDDMLSMGREPSRHESFPRVRTHLARLGETAGLGWHDIDLLARVFAAHEVGSIPETSIEILHALARQHRLGVISNVWSDSDIFLEAFRQAGVEELFDVIVFSSDHGWIKPSRRLFDLAVDYFEAPRSRVLYVGNSFDRDVIGAKGADLAVVWINPGGGDPPVASPAPDLTVACLGELLEA
jgi:FMN phosphatase YigB (HAD superfamily)